METPLVPRALQSVLSGTADKAVAIDSSGRILHANEEFLRFSGYPLSDARGRPCFEVVRCWRFDEGSGCGPDCPVIERVRSRRRLESFDVAVRRSHRNLRWLNVSCLLTPPEWTPAVAIFLLRPIGVPQAAHRLADRRWATGPRRKKKGARLSRRELSILFLLCEGRHTRGIAADLGISPATVRNHVRALLQKLSVHTRAEAVAYAFRNGLVAWHDLFDWSN
ncbi:MAG: hypothetical protein GWN84_16485 [Gammaproteobacteria bacterium]|nr:hypothetical protein [Gammaproteobacteria bacterium]NIU05485.1 hypothetical protein [Gammaproteobacteria bacterium]NIV52631.1 hypothetical protein [Gammaproteobacteria bacterium]NIX86758.1 hypothetical protein [Gammaproteobacteria bacterium]